MLKLEIIGHLGQNAEVKQINGKSYTSFSVAVKTKDKGADTTQWIEVLKYGEGGNLFPHLTKGTKVFVRGTLSANAYMANDRSAHVSLNLYTNEIQLLGDKAQAKEQTNPSQEQTNPRNGFPQQAPDFSARQASPFPKRGDGVFPESDLPF